MRHRDGVLLATLDVYPLMAMQIQWHSRISITMEMVYQLQSDSLADVLGVWPSSGTSGRWTKRAARTVQRVGPEPAGRRFGRGSPR